VTGKRERRRKFVPAVATVLRRPIQRSQVQSGKGGVSPLNALNSGCHIGNNIKEHEIH
jgi:hypothetical protein